MKINIYATRQFIPRNLLKINESVCPHKEFRFSYVAQDLKCIFISHIKIFVAASFILAKNYK